MADQTNPPTRFGWALCILGIVLALNGIRMLAMSGDAFFLLFGIGVALSGYFLAQGRQLGLHLYLASYAFIFIWRLGLTHDLSLADVLLPTILGLYIAFALRRRLT